MDYSSLGKRLITVEGGVGFYGDEYVSFIADILKSDGKDVLITREPGGTLVGEQVRNIVTENTMDVLAETLLIFGSRVQHIEEVIVPSLKRGEWVISDRFTDSTFAFQCRGRGVDFKTVKSLEILTQRGLTPGVTIFFENYNKTLKTHSVVDKFLLAGDDFSIKVADGYRDIIRKDPTRCKLVNLDQSRQKVLDQVREIIQVYSYFIDKN